jgi:hypothetical protein
MIQQLRVYFAAGFISKRTCSVILNDFLYT